MRLWSLALLLPVFSLVSNGQSIQPFYEPSDVVFKPGLVGKWDLDGVTLEFRDVGNQTYGVNLFGDNGYTLRFRVHLIHIGRNYFLDGQVAGLEAPGDETTSSNSKSDMVQKPFELDENDIFLNRHHGLILVQFAESMDEFVAHPWDQSWLPQMADKKKLHCSYLKDEMERILLTAESSCLRELVERLPVEAFDTGYTLTRLKSDAVAPIYKTEGVVRPAAFETIQPRWPEGSAFSPVGPGVSQQESDDKAEKIHALVLAGQLNEAESLAREYIAGAPEDISRLSQLDIVLNAQGRFQDADQLRDRIRAIWQRECNEKWIASGASVADSAWSRILTTSNLYYVVGVEYFEPRLLEGKKGDPFALYAYYKVIGFPKPGEGRTRILQLDKSELEKHYFLEEYSASAVTMAASYEGKMPDIRAVVRDAVSYLDRDSHSSGKPTADSKR